MKKQKQSYGCGLYAVANAFGLESYITDKRIEESKQGNTIGLDHMIGGRLDNNGKVHIYDSLKLLNLER